MEPKSLLMMATKNPRGVAAGVLVMTKGEPLCQLPSGHMPGTTETTFPYASTVVHCQVTTGGAS